MRILSTGSLYGNNERYLELNSLLKQTKPDVLLITGDMFPRVKNSPFLQAEFIESFINHFSNFSKNCDKIFYIFGDEDYVFLEETVNEYLLNETNNVFNLNNQNVNYNDYTFIGLPYVKDYGHIIKDWVLSDRSEVNFNDDTCYITNKNAELEEINDPYNYIKYKNTLNYVITEKLSNTLKNKILISHFPPQIKNFNDENIFLEELNYFINEFSYIYSGHSTMNLKDAKNFNCKIKKTNIFKHNQLEKMLLFNFNIIEKNKLKYSYYPLNKDSKEIIKNSYKYREINNAK